MKRLFTLITMGLALPMTALLAGCGNSVSSTSQAEPNQVYSVVINPTRFTLNAGDWSTVTATVDLSTRNSTPEPISPQPEIRITSSDPHVTISPSGQVCAGQWDPNYQYCTPVTDSSGNIIIPTGYVTITAYNQSHNVQNTALLSVHKRAASISLTADNWPSGQSCSSQTLPSGQRQVKYIAHPVDSEGNAVTNVYDNDYTWLTADSTVASVSTYGYAAARNPGVTYVYAKLNGTTSSPLAFASCPPKAIELAASDYNQQTPQPPYTTTDLSLIKGGVKYATATLVDSNGDSMPLQDLNGNAIDTLPLTFITTNVLSASFSTVTTFTDKLTANTSGRFSVMVACEPSNCNNAVQDFVTPDGTAWNSKSAGFGYPIYSNAIGVTAGGTSGSTVLVTGQTFSDGVTPAYRLLEYDSESMTLTHTISIQNTPNSMMVAPNGANAFIGSSQGLMVLNLSSLQSTTQTFPVVGSNPSSPEQVTGQVIGISPDSRYVLVSDPNNSVSARIYLIDATKAKNAVRYNLGGITSVAFAADGSNIWIGGSGGVYQYVGDTFVPISSYNSAAGSALSNVNALAWMPDGQSYFASTSSTSSSSGSLVNYSTCDDALNSSQPSPILPSTVTGGLATNTTGGVPHLLGLSSSGWFDYSVTTSAQAPYNSSSSNGFVCGSTVTMNTPTQTTSTAPCTATQITYGPTQDSNGNLSLPREFITGADQSCSSPDTYIHGYDVNSQQEIKIQTTGSDGNPYPVAPLSGGLLNDGRKLYFGTFDQSTQSALLHRINFDPTAGAVGEDVIPVSVQIVPQYVAVVPK
jgi:hypothetical protein